MAAPTAIQTSQFKFLMTGGLFELPLQMLIEKGLIDTDYVYREYPKHIDLDGKTVVVNSAEEEDRVYSGGKTSAQIEDERLDLMQRCRNLHIAVDPTWTIVRLRRELGMAMDAPEPVNDMDRLQAELDGLKKMAAMQAEIEALRAQLSAKPEDADELRAQLAERGVKVDGRWSIARMREELDRTNAE